MQLLNKFWYETAVSRVYTSHRVRPPFLILRRDEDYTRTVVAVDRRSLESSELLVEKQGEQRYEKIIQVGWSLYCFMGNYQFGRNPFSLSTLLIKMTP